MRRIWSQLINCQEKPWLQFLEGRDYKGYGWFSQSSGEIYDGVPITWKSNKDLNVKTFMKILNKSFVKQLF